MHLVADAADVEDHVVLAIAVDQAFELADHRRDPTVHKLPSPLRGRDERSSLLGVGGGCAPSGDRRCGPPSPTLPRKGGGSKEARRSNSPLPCGEGLGVGVSSTPMFMMPPPSSAAALRSGGDAHA